MKLNLQVSILACFLFLKADAFIPELTTTHKAPQQLSAFIP
jgi:hypothetical protein